MSSVPVASVAAESTRKSGRAVSTDRGHSVWEWQVATGVFERDVTDEQLRQLQAPELQIVEFETQAQSSGRWIQGGPGGIDMSHRATPAAARKPKNYPGALGQLWARLRG